MHKRELEEKTLHLHEFTRYGCLIHKYLYIAAIRSGTFNNVESLACLALLKRSDFSAACWLYGRRLHDRVRHPIGLISAAYYPSSITDWMPPSVRDRCEMLVPYQ